MRRALLFPFLLTTFAISWGVPGLLFVAAWLGVAPPPELRMYSPLYYVAVWAPALAGLGVVAWWLGSRGLRGFARRLTTWRVGAGWYALIFFGIPAVYFVAAVLTEAAGEPALQLPRGPWAIWAVEALRRATAGPMEELGWRGVALPLLQRRMSGARAAVVLGLIWGVWHLPAFALGALSR